MKIPRLLRFSFITAMLAAPLLCAAQEYEDWTVQCDNVKHCEAVGYGADSAAQPLLAVQLVRDAGPATETRAKIILAGDGAEKPVAVTVTVDGRRLVSVLANEPLPRAAAHALVAAMIDAREGMVSDGRQQWPLPHAGMKAALLRMDALQGRVGTPGALVRRGTRPEAAVPPAPAMPVLRAAPPAQSVDDPSVRSALLAEIGMGGDDDTGYHGLYRLADGRLLLLLEMGRGPTASFNAVWLANARPPYQPREIDLPDNGLVRDGLINADFDGQVLGSYTGRTLADCFFAAKWLWTGERFELLSLNQADHCRGLLAHVDHRKWVARRIP